MKIIAVKNESEIASAATEAARAVVAGKLVGFPTETVYGIAALATHAGAMERLRELKSRPARPFSVHIAAAADAGRYVRDIPAAAQRLMAKAWPGPVTILLPTGGALADAELERGGLHASLCYENTIGLRCPDEPLTTAMLAQIPGPVVAPSANLSGQPSPRSGEDVKNALGQRLDLLLDHGHTRYGKDSTIVSFAGPAWQVVREGVYDRRTIERLLRRTLLFVCSGNTCRSPLAAGLARKILAEKLGVAPKSLYEKGFEVVSAGVFAAEGLRASAEAVRAARQWGADISHHASQNLNSELINSADVIFCMTESHVRDVTRAFPQAASRVRKLAAQDVHDPIGGGDDEYRRTALQIERAVRDFMEKVTTS